MLTRSKPIHPWNPGKVKELEKSSMGDRQRCRAKSVGLPSLGADYECALWKNLTRRTPNSRATAGKGNEEEDENR